MKRISALMLLAFCACGNDDRPLCGDIAVGTQRMELEDELVGPCGTSSTWENTGSDVAGDCSPFYASDDGWDCVERAPSYRPSCGRDDASAGTCAIHFDADGKVDCAHEYCAD